MINANELRIGNAVIKRDYILFVKAISKTLHLGNNDTSDFIHDDFNYSDISAIELTPEILYKAGFDIPEDIVSSTHTVYKLKGQSFMVAVKEGVFYYLNYCDEDNYYSTYWPELKYLHQLQNLYFALTGKEIEIKL